MSLRMHDGVDTKHNLLEAKLMEFQKTIEAVLSSIAAIKTAIADNFEGEGEDEGENEGDMCITKQPGLGEPEGFEQRC